MRIILIYRGKGSVHKIETDVTVKFVSKACRMKDIDMYKEVYMEIVLMKKKKAKIM